MIRADQPTCFPEDVLVRVSSKDEGTVLDRAVGVHHPSTVTNRTQFCDECGISYGDVVYQRILYDEHQTYDLIERVDEQATCKHVDEIHADALITIASGVGLMLPIADCVATVFYDPVTRQLALAHLGRHSTVAHLMVKIIDELVQGGARAQDIIVWMAPSIKASHYRLEYFDHADDADWRAYAERREDGIYLDLHGYNRAAAIARGVLLTHINESPVNTATTDAYFSHSHGDTTGRFAVLAERR